MIPDAGPGILFSLLAFFMVISVLVFVHEMGHYLVARWCGGAGQCVFHRLWQGNRRLDG